MKHVVLYTFDAQQLYEGHGYVVFDELSRMRWMKLPPGYGMRKERAVEGIENGALDLK